MLHRGEDAAAVDRNRGGGADALTEAGGVLRPDALCRFDEIVRMYAL